MLCIAPQENQIDPGDLTLSFSVYVVMSTVQKMSHIVTTAAGAGKGYTDQYQ